MPDHHLALAAVEVLFQPLVDQMVLHQDRPLDHCHLLRRVLEQDYLRLVGEHQGRFDQLLVLALVPLQHGRADAVPFVHQHIVEPETAVGLDRPHVVGHRIVVCLVRLAHQVADKNLARIALANGLVDLFDQQRGDQVGEK